jgi:hypothetical protein
MMSYNGGGGGAVYGVGNPQIIKSKNGIIAFTSMIFKGEN